MPRSVGGGFSKFQHNPDSVSSLTFSLSKVSDQVSGKRRRRKITLTSYSRSGTLSWPETTTLTLNVECSVNVNRNDALQIHPPTDSQSTLSPLANGRTLDDSKVTLVSLAFLSGNHCILKSISLITLGAPRVIEMVFASLNKNFVTAHANRGLL